MVTGILFSGVYIVCPNLDCPRSNIVCAFADDLKIYVQPVIQPVIETVDNYYENSDVKIYANKLSTLVHPYTSFASGHLSSIQDQIAAVRERHEERIKKATYDSATKVIKEITIFIRDSVIPTVYEASKYLYKQFKYYGFKTRVWCHIKWNIYGNPVLYSISDRIFHSPIGEYSLKLYLHPQTQAIVRYLNVTADYIRMSIKYLVNKVREIYATSLGFKDTESYKTLQMKTNFLWDSFNYLPNQFKVDTTFSSTSTTSTITATVTITSSKPLAESSSARSVLSVRVESNAVAAAEVSTSLKYSNLLTSTIESAANDFESQVQEFNKQFKYKLYNEMQPKLAEFSKTVEHGFEEIQSAIDRINVFKDSSDEKYVSRQYFRDILAAKKNSIETEMKKLEDHVSKISEEYIDAVLKIRVDVLEILEEFAESSLNAYSAEIVSSGENWDEWKRYKELKASLVKFRDEIIEKEPADNSLINIKQLNQEVNILANEGMSYLAILRAKANLEFQEREKKERERKAREKLEAEEKEREEKERKLNAEKEDESVDKEGGNIDGNSSSDEFEVTETRKITIITTKTIDTYKNTNKPSSDEIKVVIDE